MANKDITESGVQEVLRTMGIPTSFQGLKENVVGRAETLATLGSGMAGAYAGMGGGLLEMMRSGRPDLAIDEYQRIQEAMTYMPRTQGGIERVQAIGEFLEPVANVYEQYGQQVGETTGQPVIGEFAQEFVDPLDMLGLGVVSAIPLAARKGSRFAENVASQTTQRANTVGTAVKASKKIADPSVDVKDLVFLHNTTAKRLARQMDMGGMPNPSIAITQSDIPFEGFGDITLVGKPESFDPAQRENLLYAADAYTVRAPSPVRVANKNAYKQFQSDYEAYKGSGNIDDVAYSLGDLESKSRIEPSDFRRVNDFLEYDNAAKLKFAEDNNIPVPRKENGDIDYYALSDVKSQNVDKYEQWRLNEISKYFQPEEYFVTNPDYDRYSGRANLQPYTVENVSKWMNKRSGAGEESTMAFGAGNVRASMAERIKSLEQARKMKGQLKPAEEMAEFKQTSEMMLGDLQDALKDYYQYDTGSFSYFDSVGEMIALSENKGLKRAMEEVGFKDVPDELMKEINDYKDHLRSAPTEYFESKPQRPVQLNEFAGAIVPEGTPQSTIDFLKDKGLQVEIYKDEAGRTSARKKFSNEFFVLPAAALIGASAMQSEGDQTEQPQA